MNEVIKALKKIRQEKAWSQSELGSKLGLPQSHISKIEKGGTNPRLSTVTDMARLLDTELMLIPREKLSMIRALLNDADAQKPRFSLENDEL